MFFCKIAWYRTIFWVLFAERVVFLAEETDADREQGDHDLARRRVPAPNLHAEFQSQVVDEQVYCHDQDVAHQLPAAAQARLPKRDVLIQPEACEQRDGEYDTQGRDVGCDGLLQRPTTNDKRQIDYLVPYNKVIDQEVEYPVQHQITASAGGIAEQLLRHYLPERRIEKINDPSYYLCQFLHIFGLFTY